MEAVMKPHKQSRSVKPVRQGRTVPYGYRKKGRRLEVQPREAAVVRQVFADYVSLEAAFNATIQDWMRSVRSRRAQLARQQALSRRGGK
jgi:hypothetical protein